MEQGQLTSADVERAADMLLEAERTATQTAPTSTLFPAMTMADAYRIQQTAIDKRLAEGRHIVGRKIGLTSRAMQQAMHIDEPDYGTLLDDMVFPSGSTLPARRFTDPRIEVELAFVLGERLFGEHLVVDDVLAATRWVVPALELIAARSFRVDPETGKPRGILDTIADNAASAGVILGERQHPVEIDPRWCGAILTRNGVVEETGLGAGVLNHPANGVVWLARRFARHGIALEPDQIILAGSFTRPVVVAPGDEFVADYGPHGTITCRFS